MKLYKTKDRNASYSHIQIFVWAKNEKQAIKMANNEFKKWEMGIRKLRETLERKNPKVRIYLKTELK